MLSVLWFAFWGENWVLNHCSTIPSDRSILSSGEQVRGAGPAVCGQVAARVEEGGTARALFSGL